MKLGRKQGSVTHGSAIAFALDFDNINRATRAICDLYDQSRELGALRQGTRPCVARAPGRAGVGEGRNTRLRQAQYRLCSYR